MHDKLLYLDSSALVKLVVREPESDALAAFLPDWPHSVTSALAALELVRAARLAAAGPEVVERAARVVAATHLIALDEPILAAAQNIGPADLPAASAIHLASAASLHDEIGAVVSYDRALAAAMRAAGLQVVAPGAA